MSQTDTSAGSTVTISEALGETTAAPLKTESYESVEYIVDTAATLQAEMNALVQGSPIDGLEPVMKAKKTIKTREVSKKSTYLSDLSISHEDLVIYRNIACLGKPSFLYTSMKGSHKIKDLKNDQTSVRTRMGIDNNGRTISKLHSSFNFDSNFHIVCIDMQSPQKSRICKIDKHPDIKRVNMATFPDTPNCYIDNSNEYIIVNKNKYLLSFGKDVVITSKSTNFEDAKIKETLDYLKKDIDEAISFVKHISTVVGNVYKEENFDIIYRYTPQQLDNRFYIRVLFNDITIKNSQSRSHKIGSIITSLTGTHNPHVNRGKNQFKIAKSLHGHRLTFTPLDYNCGYNHSHLSSHRFMHFAGFCLGSAIMFNQIVENYNTTDMNLELLLVGLFDFISWESLEGGPYQRFESIRGRNSRQVSYRGTAARAYTGNNMIYSTQMQALILRKIENNPTKFKDAFKLVSKNGETRYELDMHMLVLAFIDRFDKEFLMTLGSSGCNIGYNTTTKKFMNLGRNNRSESEMEKTILDDVRKVYPTYFNGKYIPLIPIIANKSKDETKVVDEIIPVFNESIIYSVGYTLLYHLNKNLQDVKTKEPERKEQKQIRDNKNLDPDYF